MDRNIQFQRACQRNHAEGQDEVIGMCFNKDCPVRLACKYCFKESFHQNHELQIFDVIGVKNVSFEEYNKLEIQERIAKQRKLFNCAKAKLIETINLLEIDFQKDIKRLEEIDNIIQNSIKMVETKNLSTFTEQHAQIIVNLHDNNISPQMDQMTSLPIINQFEELNIQLQSRLKFINIEQFLKKHLKDPRLIEFYNIRQCDYEQTPPDLKCILGFDNRDIQEGEFIYFGGVVNGLQEGRGISIDKNGHQILEGIWSKGQLKWGQKAEINSVNLAQMQTGEFINKEIQGKGSAGWSDGDKWFDVGEIYEGNFIEGKREGVGKLQWPDGEIYEGEWQNDRKEGKGCYKWKNGDLYEGNWKNNRIYGQGKLKYANGESLLGEFQQNKQQGVQYNSNQPQQISIYDRNGNLYTTVWMR